MRIAAAVEYAGQEFSGWQKQPGIRTIQGEIEKAIFSITKENINTTAAGRTDAGVHALGQIIHFDTNLKRPMHSWVKGINAFLPISIRIKWAVDVSVDFHARFSAKQREYQYLLLNQSINSAIMSHYCGWTFYKLHIDLIKKSLLKFKGKHDFNAFRSSECQANSSIRTISKINVKQHKNYFLFTFIADAFLQHQVRNMMGTIIKAGCGAIDIDHIDFLLKQNDRRLVPATFSPNGLYLTNIRYDSKWGLPKANNKISVNL
ncbi:MAG: tRNA pseudouridine(38-40) synthase TruA [Nitrosomonadales bacterium]|jgi:tRNA pseudouridine38-40 synthase|nr:tRNA pseudouridine(38-40) synthase TruA [Nitrosomonadales bacterium]MBT3917966.1 tRNA pseudouridine(38-40) synthase TruA [Nitrosomonadales bacterium]MBT4571285.1 tRNA pseudouridine(38-40) synthase TruA [Nitrosomonadales bacterium]MBT5572806.1 tRNA pseudouridine(38-40) synthase TruA [Nitrosomonadales bacterium]MBT6250908.1 tRNA pseudouridine(38-40) synthase TruA [Nitrosomonadales bacterium]